ncbi:MAG: cation transporter [Fibrobacterota bacterium]
MSGSCSDCGCSGKPLNTNHGYIRALRWALVLNFALFFVEIVGAVDSGSVSLLADAIDFFGDAVNFGASLVVIGMAAVWSSRLALAKGLVMATWGVLILARAVWAHFAGGVPVHETMTWISILALGTNLAVAAMLYRHRAGDANRSSVWLCARNDALANIAVLTAAQGVALTGKGWPDIAAAVPMALIGFRSGVSVISKARREMSTQE